MFIGIPTVDGQNGSTFNLDGGLAVTSSCADPAGAWSFIRRTLTADYQSSDNMRFAQVSCFLPADQTKTEADIQSFHQTLDAEMVTASLTAPEGGSLYDDAWSGKATLSIEGKRGSVSVKTLGVGGDFFLFHPLVLRSGSYLTAKDFMQPRTARLSRKRS